ncbi:uncharacterized protein CMU_035330 [Cryptosporidium muris RN66]|uniref:Lipoprotein n=1 Tax=Cryptosporidium muris (strain RN66) TaxID=441375 RepID=B6AGM1_CRYMR|nr:uncharacterized protein CMU_035330 [Cryptosporidium muris RN66]EEA07362.1 hypothetical protein, conserved [Cryptosporidium muris RN66]|eukprot:XP_002141711.1 hypothetical protein [Cryptosporidium muris RN66]
MMFNKFIYLGLVSGCLTLISCLEQANSFNGDVNLWAYDSPTDNADKRPIGNYGGGYYGRQTTDIRKGEIVKSSNRTYGSKAENYPYSLGNSNVLTSKSLEPLTFENKLRLYEEPFRQYILQTTGKIPSDLDMRRLRKEFLEFARISEGIKQKQRGTIYTQLDLDRSAKKRKNKKHHKKIPKYLIFEGMDEHDFKPEEVIKYMPKISKHATKEEVERVYMKVWEMLGKSKERLNILYDYYLDKYNQKNPLGPVETENERLAYIQYILDILTNSVINNGNLLDSSFIPSNLIKSIYKDLGKSDDIKKEIARIISYMYILLNKPNIGNIDIPGSERFNIPLSSEAKEVHTHIRSAYNNKHSKKDDKEVNISETEQNKEKSKLYYLLQKSSTKKFKSEAQIKFEDSKWVSQSLKRVANNQGDYVIVEKRYCTTKQWEKLLKLARVREVDNTSRLEQQYLNQYKNDYNTVPSMYGSAMGRNLAKEPKFVFIYKNFEVTDLDNIDISNLEVIEGYGLEITSKKRDTLEAVVKHPETGFKMNVNYSKPGLPLVNLYLDDDINYTFKFDKREYLNSLSLDIKNAREVLTESLKLTENDSNYYSSFITDKQKKSKFMDKSKLIEEKLNEILDIITKSENWIATISYITEKERLLLSKYSKLEKLSLLEDSLAKQSNTDVKLSQIRSNISIISNQIVLLDSKYRNDLDIGERISEDSKLLSTIAFKDAKEMVKLLSIQYLLCGSEFGHKIDLDYYNDKLSKVINSVLINKLYIQDINSTYEEVHNKYLSMVTKNNLSDKTRRIFLESLKSSKNNSQLLSRLKSQSGL